MSGYSTLFDPGDAAPETNRWWTWISELLLVVYELMWVLLWYRIMAPQAYAAAPALNTAILTGVMLISYLATKGMNALRLMRNLQLGLLSGVFIASLILVEGLLVGDQMGDLGDGLMGLRLESIYAALVTFWLWWRGFSLANDGLRPIVVWRRFRAGLLGFMAYLFYAVQSSRPVPGLAWFMVFLFVGLLAMIFARIAYVGIIRGALRNPFDRRWVLGVSVILLVVVLVIGAAGSLLSGQYRLVSDLLELGLQAIWLVFALLVGIPIVLLAFLLEPVMQWLAGVMGQVDMSQFQPPQITPTPGDDPLQQLVVEPSQAMFYLQAACFWVLLVALAVFLFWRVRQGYLERGEATREEPESLLERGEAGRLLRQAVKDAFDDLLHRLRPAQRALAAARVRQIYAEWLELCIELGCPRLPAATPQEFLLEAEGIFVQQKADLGTITQAYQLVRYGEYPETAAQVQEVEAAWKRVAAEGQQLKTQLKAAAASSA